MTDLSKIFRRNVSATTLKKAAQVKKSLTLEDVKDQIVGNIDKQIAKCRAGDTKRAWFRPNGEGWYISFKYGVVKIKVNGHTEIGPFPKDDVGSALGNLRDAVQDGTFDKEIQVAWVAVVKIAQNRKPRTKAA